MNTVMIVLTAIVAAGACIVLYVSIHRYRYQNRSMQSRQRAIDRLYTLIYDTGFQYDKEQDIFISRVNAMPHVLSCSSLFDHDASYFSMIFEYEPITFPYDGKDWLIELWKGQYGITSGCGMGVYTAVKGGGDDTTGYRAASNLDWLPMRGLLIRHGQRLFLRQGTHWWVNGFVLGTYSVPHELTMPVTITLQSETMASAFLYALSRKGYPAKRLDDGRTVRFVFARASQPQKINPVRRFLAQLWNRILCAWFNALTWNELLTDKKLETLILEHPFLFRLLFNLPRIKGRRV